jgi:DNA-binding NtrC family response regulator
MPARMQVDLLRALQEKMIRPVGGAKDIQVDVRVIAASNRSLADAVKQGSFREDLFYRLHVIRLALPALRERADDIPLLVEHFLTGIAARMKCEKPRITKQALRCLMSYEWPGNVRQLEHTLMNAVVLAEGDILDEDDFTLESPLAVVGAPPEPVRSAEESDRHGREREEILAALARVNWNKSRAAAELGMPRRTFYRRLRSYGIQ